ncbi:MAG TPA: S9 family peptidase [Thermoanaerobaculia bacterium]|nr:S9 family peptidase [Thermoanaerobaculia bacterium]
MNRFILILLLVAAPVSGATMSIEDSASVANLSAPQFSPDGLRIAYVISRADLIASVHDSDLRVVDLRSGSDTAITSGAGADTNPRWSPDGTRIAFLSDRDGRNAIYLIEPGKEVPQKLTDEAAAIRSFEWSPDGSAIAFQRTDLASAEEDRRSREKDDARVVGEGTRHVHLHIIDVASRRVRRLTQGPFSVTSLSWSPDGEELAIERAPGTGLDDLYRTDIYTIKSAGSCHSGTCPPMTPVVVREGADRMPQFSPDGMSIAFVSTGGRRDWLQESALFVINLAGRKIRLLSRAYDRSPETFAWTSDSRSLWFDGPLDTTSQLFHVNSTGTGFRNVSKLDGVLTYPHIDRSGKQLAFISQTLTSPPELYISGLESFAPRQLTRHNEHLKNRELGRTSLIRWKNRSDNLPIEGLLTLPVGYVEGRRYPLITFVHGGPASRFDQTFLGYLGSIYPVHVLAARGFAVLRPNPRGTGSYGQAFRAGNDKDWGGKDLGDIEAGIDALLLQGIADPARLGLMGWSYGGYIAATALARSNRFRAYSIGAPMVDLLSMHGTSDIRDFIPAYFGTPPPLDLLRQRSPLWHLRKTKAKVLIQHGEADDRVPLSQGTMLYRSLQELGVDVTMVIYPRSGHVPREPKLRMDVARRNVEFFERTLK